MSNIRGPTLLQLVSKLIRSGPLWVSVSCLAIIAATVWVTSTWWDRLAGDETSIDVIRTMALIAGGLITFVVASWRLSIADKQREIADNQRELAQRSHQHERFHRATEMLASLGLQNSHTRLYGLRALRHLVRDAPGLGADIAEVVTVFVLHASSEEGFQERELVHARETAEFVLDRIEQAKIEDLEVRRALREEIDRTFSMAQRQFADSRSPD